MIPLHLRALQIQEKDENNRVKHGLLLLQGAAPLVVSLCHLSYYIHFQFNLQHCTLSLGLPTCSHNMASGTWMCI